MVDLCCIYYSTLQQIDSAINLWNDEYSHFEDIYGYKVR